MCPGPAAEKSRALPWHASDLETLLYPKGQDTAWSFSASIFRSGGHHEPSLPFPCPSPHTNGFPEFELSAELSEGGFRHGKEWRPESAREDECGGEIDG